MPKFGYLFIFSNFFFLFLLAYLSKASFKYYTEIVQIESLHGLLLIISILFSLHINRNYCFVLCQSGMCKFTKFYSEVHCLLSSAGGQKKPT